MLHGYDRWPTWMWANEEVVDFAEWLRRRDVDTALAAMRCFAPYGEDPQTWPWAVRPS